MLDKSDGYGFVVTLIIYVQHLSKPPTSDVIKQRNIYAEQQAMLGKQMVYPGITQVLPITITATTITDYNMLLQKPEDKIVHRNIVISARITFDLLRLGFLVKINWDPTSQCTRTIK